MTSGQCILKSTSNCETYSTEGLCLTCKPGYYLATGQTTQCLAVTTTVANCNYYSGPSTCSSCLTNFYIKGTICEAVTTVIANCFEYSGPDNCLRCLSGFLNDIENKQCRAISSVANCKRSSNVSCLECDNTTFYQENYV